MSRSLSVGCMVAVWRICVENIGNVQREGHSV